MTGREYLLQYKLADRRARRFRREYEKELELIDTVRSTADIDGLPRGNGINKRVEDRAVRLADKAMEWKMAELDALHIRQEIFETVSAIGGDEADVLIERYINCKTWTDVCVSVHWSWYKVRELHNAGIAKLEQIIK